MSRTSADVLIRVERDKEGVARAVRIKKQHKGTSISELLVRYHLPEFVRCYLPEFVGEVAMEVLLLATFQTLLIPSAEKSPSSDEFTSKTFSKKDDDR